MWKSGDESWGYQRGFCGLQRLNKRIFVCITCYSLLVSKREFPIRASLGEILSFRWFWSHWPFSCPQTLITGSVGLTEDLGLVEKCFCEIGPARWLARFVAKQRVHFLSPEPLRQPPRNNIVYVAAKCKLIDPSISNKCFSQRETVQEYSFCCVIIFDGLMLKMIQWLQFPPLLFHWSSPSWVERQQSKNKPPFWGMLYLVWN